MDFTLPNEVANCRGANHDLQRWHPAAGALLLQQGLSDHRLYGFGKLRADLSLLVGRNTSMTRSTVLGALEVCRVANTK